jgi:hypothetical protein
MEQFGRCCVSAGYVDLFRITFERKVPNEVLPSGINGGGGECLNTL